MRIGILLSGRGRGTNMQAIVAACRSAEVAGEVVAVVSTTRDAPALARAEEAGVEAVYVDPASTPEALDRRLVEVFDSRRVDLICLTGYMRLLGPAFMARFAGRVMNVHPSLLPAFGGKGCYGGRVHEAVLESGARFSGATIHFADQEYDHGPIILQ